MIDIRFNEDFPRELRRPVRAILKTWAPFFCTTVDRLYLRAEDDDGAGARIAVRRNYRDATIWLSAGWMRMSDVEREEFLVHELAHILVEPVQTAAMRQIEQMDVGVQEIFSELLEDAVEGATEDVARAVWRARQS